MSEIHYGKCEKCHTMGGLYDSLVCLDCTDEKRLISKTLKRHLSSALERIQQLENELAKEKAVVDYYADKDVWESGEVEHYKDVVDIHDCYFLDVGKIYTDAIRYGGKRARARQKERSEG